ncbi:MAG: DUF4870 domain-containing protein [Limosilactobacillus sp.]|jgi:uncharacterized Tic20 family protein|uniref:DUF4870 domain-containing protein n=1 Tax=Limosilactobacillus sp. TaxID=2773925 RepID=UPI0025BE0EB6|nr:DUF4870 domain-containing protein [Limosilactobacillus sp.]MCI1974340.1 DUF4870 domain-containing protein [Limosilactobacillus sp.]MCI2030455.1 DUF4870 domain-containing protein [Limosilactobacillus sp.]
MNNISLSKRIIGALSYLSILFLPVIFPLIVWIVAGPENPWVKRQAKFAFWSQIFPLIYIIFALLFISVAAWHSMVVNLGAFSGVLLTFALLIALLLYVYNIAMAVKVLLGRE